MPGPLSFTVIKRFFDLVKTPNVKVLLLFTLSICIFIASRALSIKFPVIVTRASDGIEISSFLKIQLSSSTNLTLHSDALQIFPISKAEKEALSIAFMIALTVSLWIIEIFSIYASAFSYSPIWIKPKITWSLLVKSWLFARIESTRNLVPSKSSVKLKKLCLIFLKSVPEISVSKIIAMTVTTRKSSTVWIVTIIIEVLSLIVMINPEYSPFSS